jgi:hypothetical protein
MRHRHAGDGERRDHAVNPRIAEIAGEKPAQQADRKSDHRRQHREHDSVADGAGDLFDDRPPGRD